MKTLKSDGQYIGYLDSQELAKTQKVLNEAERNLRQLDKSCMKCSAPSYAMDDAGNYLCEDHHYKFSN